MSSVSHHEIREELQRVLRSRHFVKGRKKSRFLEYVCRETLAGRGDQLNEHLIGIEIYDRGSDFNPHEDSIVRVQAHEIRRSLERYYESEGKDDPVRIELQPGNYIPTFSRPPNGSGRAQPGGHEDGAQRQPRLGSSIYRYLTVALGLTALALGVLLIQARSGGARPEWEVAYSPSMDWFWAPFLKSDTRPLVVVPVHPLLRAAHEGDSERTRAAGYVIPKDQLMEFRDTIHYRELKEFAFVPSTTDFTAVGETLGLVRLFQLFASAGQTCRVKASRLVDFEEVKATNAVLLGGNQSWSGRIFLYKDGFWFREGLISNQNPQPGELEVYRPVFDAVTNELRKDYALILMLPNENRDRRILLSYGIYTQGSQAAIEFITNRDHLEELRRALIAASPDRVSPPEYFQALIETTVENAVPGRTSLAAVRVVPPPSAATIALSPES